MLIKRFPIHWLHSQAYCEYQLYLEKVEGVVIKPTQEMEIGQEIHSVLETQHKKRATVTMTTTEALKESIEKQITYIGREVRVIGTDIYGLIDEVQFCPDKVIIIDDKPGDRVYNSDIRQIGGYCLAFEEHYNPDLPIIGTRRNRDTQEITWTEEFSDTYRNKVRVAIERVKGILKEEREAVPTKFMSKCRGCRLNRVCDKSLYKSN